MTTEALRSLARLDLAFAQLLVMGSSDNSPRAIAKITEEFITLHKELAPSGEHYNSALATEKAVAKDEIAKMGGAKIFHQCYGEAGLPSIILEPERVSQAIEASLATEKLESIDMNVGNMRGH